MAVATAVLHVLLPRQSTAGSHRTQSNSLSSIISTLVPILIVSSLLFVTFLFLRQKVLRVYHPRSLETIVPRHDETPASQPGAFAWLSNLNSLSETHVLQHQSLDGFLFLRFMRRLAIVCCVGCVLTWPILFPVNATGGGGQSQLDLLSFSNVANPNRYYAHALVAWLFLSFVVYVVTRERIFFIGLRQAYFLSSFHAQRLSSRTVLFLGIPEEELGQQRLREVLGPHVRKIWMVSDCKDLEESVEEMNKLWAKFEKGQVSLITDSNKKRMKSGSITAENDPYKFLGKRPTHKLRPIIGKKVDTIEYGRTELPKMMDEIEKQQEDGGSKLLSAAFIEFSSQAAAQEAYQVSCREKKTSWNPRYIGVQPQEVIWKNLGVGYKSRQAKMLIATVFIVLLTIFWAIPVAFIGILTNINYLTEKVPFLSFINDIPSVILGVVTGLLPSLLLAVLMALVPILCRLLAKFAGAPTLSVVELKTQSWYFIFQVIQVFLVTTFTSGAASVASQIVQNPASAVTLLAENLPNASNFYISYFLVFGLMAAAMELLNLVPFLLIVILGRFMDKTPRKMYNRWMGLTGLGWGSVYPKFTNLGVIALSYSCIAPLVLGFATIGFTLLYYGFRYNFLFVYGIKVDMKGESYSRALQQLLTGVYLSVICLIGLFAIGAAGSTSSVGPLVLMIVFLVALIAYQILLNIALGPLEQQLPLDLLEQNEESVITAQHIEEGKHHGEEDHGDDSGMMRKEKNFQRSGDPSAQQPWQPSSTPEERKANFLTRWARPRIDKIFERSRILLSGSDLDDTVPCYTAEDIDNAYLHPALYAERPFVWLPSDKMGLSKALLEENRKVGIDGTDKGAWLNEEGKVEWDQYHPQRAPIWLAAKVW